MPYRNSNFGHHLVRMVKILKSARAGATTLAGVDPTTYVVLFALDGEPTRLSDLAERIYTEMSTVSRQVSALAALGLVEKVADPTDGRAQLLCVTEAGRDTLDRLRAERDQWLADVTSAWSPEDINAFAAYLERFATDMERSLKEAAAARETA